MLLVKSLCFLLILLFHTAVFSQTEQVAVFPQTDFFQTQQATTAAEVLFNFAANHTKDIDTAMGSTWVEDILNHTEESWTINDAIELLNSLKELPIPDILKKLKDTQSLQRVQKEQSNDSRFQTGSDVFIDYVRGHFREKLQQRHPGLEGEAFETALENLILSQMASRRNAPLWEERIHNDAQSWNARDAALFLNDLENKWGVDADIIIKRLNATSFFETSYTSFTSRLEVYTEYLGRNHVKEILDNTFSPFNSGSAENTRATFDAVLTYFDFEQDTMVEILSKNLHIVGNMNSDIFDRKVSWLEGFIGRGDRHKGKQEIKRIVRKKKSLNIIVSVGIKLNRKTGEYENETAFRVNFLTQRGGYDREEVIELFISNSKAFSTGSLSDDKITYLEDLLGTGDRNGETELNWMIQNKGLQGIVQLKVYKNHTGQLTNNHIEFLKKRGLTPKQIADLFKANPQAFSMGDLSDDKITYLEKLLGAGDRDGETELNWMIHNRSFEGIAHFKVHKNKEGQPTNKYVEFLKKRGLTPEQIADVFKGNSRAFSKGDLSDDKITYLEEYLGKGDKDKGKKKLNQIILKKGGFQTLALFDYNHNTQPANTVIDFLENDMHFNQDQVIKIMEDHFSKLFVEDLTKETSKEYVRRVIEKTPDICQGSLS